MHPCNRRQVVLGAALYAAAPTLLWAQQDYPTKPIRFVVPYPPGGIADIMARVLQPGLQAHLGQPVLVENRAGAGGNLGTDVVAKAPGDGYTILFGASGPLAVNQTLYKGKLPYDPEHDLRGIAQLAAFPLVLVARPDLPFSTVPEFIAWLKASPEGPRAYASAGNGTPQHLAAELFARSANLKLRHIPYRGAGPAIIDIIGGRLPFMFENAGGAIPHVRSGVLKAVAVTSARRLDVLSTVPTLAEGGVTGFDFTAWNGASAPRTTPDAVIDKLNRAFQEVLRAPAIQAKWAELGSFVTTGTASAFDALIHAESRRLGALVTELGVTAG